MFVFGLISGVGNPQGLPKLCRPGGTFYGARNAADQMVEFAGREQRRDVLWQAVEV